MQCMTSFCGAMREQQLRCAQLCKRASGAEDAVCGCGEVTVVQCKGQQRLAGLRALLAKGPIAMYGEKAPKQLCVTDRERPAVCHALSGVVWAHGRERVCCACEEAVVAVPCRDQQRRGWPG